MSVTQNVLDRLRGEHKSIRYRFGILPREWTTLAIYRLLGRSWIDFYLRRLDRFAYQSIDKPVSAAYLDQGAVHLEYLKKHGLRPGDMFLDYGCGVMRLGLRIIPYLSEDRYVGVDISEGRLIKGRRLLAERGIGEDRYEVWAVTDCSLREIVDHRFDMVWAKSVFTHMPKDDIRAMLSSLRPLLKPGARFFFTFSASSRPIRKKIKDFYYPEDMLRRLCVSQGYEFEVMADWDAKTQGDTMVRIQVARDADSGAVR